MTEKMDMGTEVIQSLEANYFWQRKYAECLQEEIILGAEKCYPDTSVISDLIEEPESSSRENISGYSFKVNIPDIGQRPGEKVTTKSEYYLAEKDHCQQLQGMMDGMPVQDFFQKVSQRTDFIRISKSDEHRSPKLMADSHVTRHSVSQRAEYLALNNGYNQMKWFLECANAEKQHQTVLSMQSQPMDSLSLCDHEDSSAAENNNEAMVTAKCIALSDNYIQLKWMSDCISAEEHCQRTWTLTDFTEQAEFHVGELLVTNTSDQPQHGGFIVPEENAVILDLEKGYQCLKWTFLNSSYFFSAACSSTSVSPAPHSSESLAASDEAEDSPAPHSLESLAESDEAEDSPAPHSSESLAERDEAEDSPAPHSSESLAASDEAEDSPAPHSSESLAASDEAEDSPAPHSSESLAASDEAEDSPAPHSLESLAESDEAEDSPAPHSSESLADSDEAEDSHKKLPTTSVCHYKCEPLKLSLEDISSALNSLESDILLDCDKVVSPIPVSCSISFPDIESNASSMLDQVSSPLASPVSAEAGIQTENPEKEVPVIELETVGTQTLCSCMERRNGEVQTEGEIVQCCKCSVYSFVPLGEQFVMRLKEEMSQRITLENLIKIVERDAWNVRSELVDEREKVFRLQEEAADLKGHMTEGRHISAELKTRNDELEGALEGARNMINTLEQQISSTNYFKSGIDYMLESKLAKGRAVEAQSRVEVVQNELLHSQSEVNRLLEQMTKLTKEKNEMVSSTLHQELMQIAEDKARDAELKALELENEMFILKEENKQLKSTVKSAISSTKTQQTFGAGIVSSVPSYDYIFSKSEDSYIKYKVTQPLTGDLPEFTSYIEGTINSYKDGSSQFQKTYKEISSEWGHKSFNDTPEIFITPPVTSSTDPDFSGKPLISTGGESSDDSDWSSEEDDKGDTMANTGQSVPPHNNEYRDRAYSSPIWATLHTGPKPTVAPKPKLAPKPKTDLGWDSTGRSRSVSLLVEFQLEKGTSFEEVPRIPSLPIYRKPRGPAGRQLPAKYKHQ